MVTRWKVRALLVALLGVVLSTAPADAQIRFATTGGFGGGPVFGGFPGGGGWGVGGWGAPGWGSWGGLGPYYNSYSGWSVYPGIAAVSTTPAPRARPTLSPAVAVHPDILLPRNEIRQASTAAAAASDSQRAAIHVVLPSAKAEVWFDNIAAGQTGVEREYLTPPLEGGRYIYDVRARWTDPAGKSHSATQSITFRPGDRIRVQFSEAAEQLPAPKSKK